MKTVNQTVLEEKPAPVQDQDRPRFPATQHCLLWSAWASAQLGITADSESRSRQ